jgi:hypothetical protein
MAEYVLSEVIQTTSVMHEHPHSSQDRLEWATRPLRHPKARKCLPSAGSKPVVPTFAKSAKVGHPPIAVDKVEVSKNGKWEEIKLRPKKVKG